MIPDLRQSLLLAITIGAALGLLSGCSQEESKPQPTVAVQVVTARRTKVERRVVTEAVLFPLQQFSSVAKVSAPVRKYYVNRGNRVKAGQLLAELENSDLAASEVENKGALEQAQANYESTVRATLPEEIQKAALDTEAAKAALDAEQKVYESRQKLYQEGALPRKDFDQAAVSLTQAQNQYTLARKHLESLQSFGQSQEVKAVEGQLTAAKGRYQGAQAQLSYTKIRSPIDGVVADLPLYPGEMASTGSPVVTVMDTSQVIARAHISQLEAGLLKLGDSATFSLPASSEQDRASGDDDRPQIQGKVTVVSPALDPNSTTVEVWAQASNPEGLLKPGGVVQVSILVETIPQALVIPSAALLTSEEGKTSVMVVGSDDHAHQQSVKVGVRQGEEVQITEGLKEGDHVVAAGAYGLPDNTKVHAETAKAPAEAK